MQKWLGKKHPRIFYGWWVVGASFLITLYTGGVVFFGFTAVFEPLANEFGWGYAQISLAASLRGFEMGLLAPLVGLVVDRWGPRRLIFTGAIFIGLGLMLLSRINSLGMFYGAFILIAIGMSAASSTVLLTAVVNWFREKVAIATGIVVSGFAVGGALVPVVTGTDRQTRVANGNDHPRLVYVGHSFATITPYSAQARAIWLFA